MAPEVAQNPARAVRRDDRTGVALVVRVAIHAADAVVVVVSARVGHNASAWMPKANPCSTTPTSRLQTNPLLREKLCPVRKHNATNGGRAMTVAIVEGVVPNAAKRIANRATRGVLTTWLPPMVTLRAAIPRGKPAKVVTAATVAAEMVVDPVPTEKTAMRQAIPANPNWVLQKATTTSAMVHWNKPSPTRVCRHHRPVLKTASPVKSATATVTAANVVHVATEARTRSVRICASPFNPPR